MAKKRKRPGKTPTVSVPKGKRKSQHNTRRNYGAAKRTNDQQEADRALIAQMMANGYKTVRILESVNKRNHPITVSMRLIQQEMAAIRDTWHTLQMQNLTVFVNRELEFIDYIQVEALDGWERSKAGLERTEAEKADFSTGGQRAGTRSKVTRQNSAGNPEFLATAIKCHERRCRLLGIDRDQTPHSGGSADQPPVPLPLPAGNSGHILEIQIVGQENADGISGTVQNDA